MPTLNDFMTHLTLKKFDQNLDQFTISFKITK